MRRIGRENAWQSCFGFNSKEKKADSIFIKKLVSTWPIRSAGKKKLEIQFLEAGHRYYWVVIIVGLI